MDSFLWIPIPVIPAMRAGSFLVDTVALNPYHFWFGDAWGNEGTAFKSAYIESGNGAFDSVLVGGGRLFTKN